jgi:hypothetical protein
MSTSPSDGSKPKPSGMAAFMKQAIRAEHARSHTSAEPSLELVRCANCGAMRERETSRAGETLYCSYCGNPL